MLLPVSPWPHFFNTCCECMYLFSVLSIRCCTNAQFLLYIVLEPAHADKHGSPVCECPANDLLGGGLPRPILRAAPHQGSHTRRWGECVVGSMISAGKDDHG